MCIAMKDENLTKLIRSYIRGDGDDEDAPQAEAGDEVEEAFSFEVLEQQQADEELGDALRRGHTGGVERPSPYTRPR